MKRVVFTIPEKELIFVFRKGKTTNKKISAGGELVQTYTFSYAQYELANKGEKITQKEFFSLDQNNCLDCPYSGNMGNGGCYTHKFMQYSGFLSMLRSIKKEDLTVINDQKYSDIVEMSYKVYVRFGTYGEPSLLPVDLVKSMAYVSSSYTGYTHQYEKEWAKDYSKWFMASTHNQSQTNKAKDLGFRSFVSVVTDKRINGINCPASKEQNFKSNCEKCALCSGAEGKGNKDVFIIEH